MRDHRNRGGRFCNNNSTSIHTRFRHKIDKIMKTHAGPCESMWLHNYYGRRLDPNTKAFSAAYNDAVDIANKNRLTFLALEYATNPENMRIQCVFSHFQRRKTGLSILQQQSKLFFLQFSKKKNGGVDTATTIKLHFLSLKSSKNR